MRTVEEQKSILEGFKNISVAKQITKEMDWLNEEDEQEIISILKSKSFTEYRYADTHIRDYVIKIALAAQDGFHDWTKWTYDSSWESKGNY